MSILFSTPPDEASQAVASNLQRVSDRPQVDARGLGGAAAAEVTPTMPHGVYVLGLKDVLNGKLPDDLAPSGWRYILSGGSEVACAETQVRGNAHKFSGFNSGPYVSSTVDALQRVTDLPMVKEENLTLRMLRIPALHLTALWLHGENQDIFTPLEPAPPSVSANKQYQAAELFAALRSEAESRANIGPADLTGG